MWALVDSYLEVEIGRFDPRKAVLASIVEISTLVAEEVSNVRKETVGSLFHVNLPHFADEVLCGVGMSVRHVVMLLIAPQFTYAPEHRADETALVFRWIDWGASFDGDQVERHADRVQYWISVMRSSN